MRRISGDELEELKAAPDIWCGRDHNDVSWIYELDPQEIDDARWLNSSRLPPRVWVVVAVRGSATCYSLQFAGMCVEDGPEFLAESELIPPRPLQQRAMDRDRQHQEEIEYQPGEKILAVLEHRFGLDPGAIFPYIHKAIELEHRRAGLLQHPLGDLIGMQRHYPH